MTAAPDVERPCTPRKRLELAKEVDRETAVMLDKDTPSHAAPPSSSPSSPPSSSSSAPLLPPVETLRGGLRSFCESFVGAVVKQASVRFG